MSSDSSPEPPAISFWSSVRQSLRGEDHDYTALPLNRAVILLAVPMVLEMIMESLFAVADVFWVSRLGKEAVAVVGITESIMTLIYAVAIGISIAATAIVSRRIGEKEPELAAQAAGQIVLLGVLVSSALGIVLGIFAPDILRLMGAGEEIVTLGSGFARVMLGGNVTVFMIFLINAVFRGAGDAVVAMRTLWLANALNIVLGPCFIFGWWIFPEMGVTGAAVATNIGRGVGVLYQLWHLAGHHSRVKVRWHHFKPEREIIISVLSKSGSGIAQLLISTTSWVGLFKILAMFGSTALAGYTIAIRIVTFALMPAWGLANAGATLVGQNLGAQKPERAEAAVKIAMKLNVIVLGGVGLVFVLLAHPLIGLFTTEPDVVAFGTQSLWIVSLAFPMYAAGMCFEAAFNGAGDTWTPARLSFMCLWVLQIPLAWLLAKTLGFGPIGAVISVPTGFSLLAVWSWFLFKRGKWKARRVFERLLPAMVARCLIFFSAVGLLAADTPEQAVEKAHTELWRRFVDEHNLILDYVGLKGEIVRPTPDDCREMKPSALNWGVPNEDGPMFNGLYLDAACNRWTITQKDEDRAKAGRLIDGLIKVSTIGKTPGFIARGIATDGKTTYPMGSNDQTTPWLYGIWRYVTDGVAKDETEKKELITRFIEQVTILDQNGWKMPTDGPPSKYRGDFLKPTWEGAPRILFVMKAMHRFTGDATWQQRYLDATNEKVGKGQRQRIEICRTGMVFDPGQGARHSWTGSEGVVCLRARWEMETDAALKAAYAEGLRRSAELSAQSLMLIAKFDVNGKEIFDVNWRVMNEAWKPQHSEEDAVAVANAGLRVQHKASPRMHIEKDYLREPCFAAWVVALCPDREFVMLHRAAIEKVITHYDVSRVYLSQFFPIESAWWRLQQRK